MKYYSTNRGVPEVSFEDAVLKGLPDDNGLYMPVEVPQLGQDFFKRLPTLGFQEIAFEVASRFIEQEIDPETLRGIVADAFDFEVPVRQLEDDIHVLELFHGPTLAFKDFGARFMARVMGHFLEHKGKEVNILVATSGDTGSAVAQGFYGIPGIKVTLLYPRGKVSKIQEQQLTTVGKNVTALEVDGTFDDCQRLVKTAFLDKALNDRMSLSSANSINIARLVPQAFYYFHAYARVMEGKNPVVFCVPSGNFGNLCAGLLAKKMGLPVKRFVAATNANDIVPEFLRSNHFNPRPSIRTISNAMDVGNPSNFVRLTELYGHDFEAINADIQGIAFTDDQTRTLIKDVFERLGYVTCPHTAIGYGGLKTLLRPDAGETGIFLATAHPAKFIDVVEPIIGEKVEIPDRLKKIIEKEKQAISISTNFAELKSLLLDTL